MRREQLLGRVGARLRLLATDRADQIGPVGELTVELDRIDQIVAPGVDLNRGDRFDIPMPQLTAPRLRRR